MSKDERAISYADRPHCISRTQQSAFETGDYADIVVRAGSAAFRLHQLVLGQSPTLRELMSRQTTTELVLPISDSPGLEIALRSLYGSHRSSITDQNSLSVMLAASYLGLEALSHQAFAVAHSAISRLSTRAEVTYWVAALHEGTDDAAAALREALVDHLVVDLPVRLAAFGPQTDTAALAEIYAALPFSLLKRCLEDPKLGGGRLPDHTRLQFARRCVTARGNGESVVMAIGASSAVQVIESQRARRLWKASG